MPAWSDFRSGVTAAMRLIAGLPRQSAQAAGPSAPRVVYVLIVADDILAAKCLIRTMAISWERFGSAHRKDGLEIVFRVEPHDGWGLGRFAFSLENNAAARNEPFSLRAEDGSIDGRSMDEMLDGSFELNFRTPPDGAVIAKTNVVVRLIGPRYFTSERVGAATIAALVRNLDETWRAWQAAHLPADAASASRRDESDTAPINLIVMGITDAWLHSGLQPSVGSGVDKILSPSMLPELSALSGIAPPKLALVITGLERDFARFNPRRGNGTKYSSAQRAAWDPRLINRMLKAVLERRPHLVGLLHNDSAFRPAADAVTVTAAMPCGFVNGLGFGNYNAWDPGWIVGAPWVGEEKQSPDVVPYHCADALITALTGRTTEFQLTTRDIVSDRPLRRPYGRVSGG